MGGGTAEWNTDDTEKTEFHRLMLISVVIFFFSVIRVHFFREGQKDAYLFNINF